VEGLLGFVLAGFALAGSPGPATLSLAATGAAFGARRGLPYMAGIVIGMLAVMGITASGVVGVLLAVPGATPVVVAMAAAYFVYLAFRVATAPPLADDAGQGRQPSFAGGVFLSLVNPKGLRRDGGPVLRFRPRAGASRARHCGQARGAGGDHHRSEPGMAHRRSGAHALLPGACANRIINVTFAILLVASVFALLF